jgi:hypothetical protein
LEKGHQRGELRGPDGVHRVDPLEFIGICENVASPERNGQKA